MRADAVIVGGGPAGCAAALGLARAGVQVVLLERGSGHKPGEIVEAMIRLPLSELGLLESFEALNSLLLVGSLSLWDGEAPVEFHGIMNPYGHGALIDRQNFERWFIDAAARAGVRVIAAARPVAAETDNGGWRISGTANGRMLDISAPLIIEATGRGRGLLGNSDREVKDRLVAFLTYGATLPGSRDQRLIIEAGTNGWWYAAPLPGNKAVVAFMTDADLVPRSAAHRTQYVREQLTATTIVREFAKQLLEPGPLFGFPANSSLKRIINGRNWITIGDAAASYDPLSGRGVAVALAKGAAIARLLTTCSDRSQALDAYADAERATFSDYLIDQSKTYRRGAKRFRSPFWYRRAGNSS
jgi:flavin-dependent dehydrogenase